MGDLAALISAITSALTAITGIAAFVWQAHRISTREREQAARGAVRMLHPDDDELLEAIERLLHPDEPEQPHIGGGGQE